MKILLLGFVLVLSLPSFAEGTFSNLALDMSARGETLPPDLHFETDHVKILNAVWFASIFGTRPCDILLTPAEISGRLEIYADGAHAASITLNGRPPRMLSRAQAGYVPVHYQRGQPIHPYFLIKLPDWVTLHAVIHRTGETKSLILSVIQGRGLNAHLVPVLEATGS